MRCRRWWAHERLRSTPFDDRAVTSVEGPRHLIVTGAPGNGKTTVSRFLGQVYRSAFLDGTDDFGSEQVRVIDGTVDALRRIGRDLLDTVVGRCVSISPSTCRRAASTPKRRCIGG